MAEKNKKIKAGLGDHSGRPLVASEPRAENRKRLKKRSGAEQKRRMKIKSETEEWLRGLGKA